MPCQCVTKSWLNILPGRLQTETESQGNAHQYETAIPSPRWHHVCCLSVLVASGAQGPLQAAIRRKQVESRRHHATTASDTFLKEMESENHSSEKQCGMELMGYLFDPDQGMWRGHVKAKPKHQVSGESFEVLQVKLRQLRLERCR